jgi:hypothetical protein
MTPINLSQIKRLVIVVPDEDVEEPRLSRYLWSQASPGKLSILLVTLVDEPGNEFTALRRLAQIRGITQDIWVKVERRVVFGHSWSKALRLLLGPTDALFCPVEKTIMYRWFSKRPLSQTLQADLNREVLPLSGFYTDNTPHLPHWVHQIPFWIGCLLTLGIFSVLEFDVNRMASGWVGQLVFIGLVLAEVGFLYVMSAMGR